MLLIPVLAAVLLALTGIGAYVMKQQEVWIFAADSVPNGSVAAGPGTSPSTDTGVEGTADSSASETTPAPTASPTPTALTPETALLLDPATAQRELQTLVQAEAATVASLAGSWVPQVSSKCPGLAVDIEPAFVPDGEVDTAAVTAPQILAFHLALTSRYGAVTTTAAVLGSESLPSICSADTLWVSLVPQRFAAADPALAWCAAGGIPVDECGARRVVPAGTDGTVVELRDQ